MADQNVDPTFEANVIRPGRLHSDAQLRKLAMDVNAGHVFGSWMLGPHDQHIYSMVFMTLAFMKPEMIEDMKRKEVVQIYEYLNKAGPRSVNGFPMFTSHHELTKADVEKLTELIAELKKRLGEFAG